MNGVETRITVRPVGSALPFGLLGLTAATVLLSALQLSWIPDARQHAVFLGVLVFTVPAQAIACVFGFLARDPVAGTGLGVLCTSWAAIGVTGLLGVPGATSPVLAVVLCIAAGILLVPVAVAATGKVLAAGVFFLAAARFVVTAVYEFTGSTGWQLAGGVLGLVVAGVAGYAALAFELEDSRGRTVLPTWRLGAARHALSGPIREQLRGIAHEAGIREEL